MKNRQKTFWYSSPLGREHRLCHQNGEGPSEKRDSSQEKQAEKKPPDLPEPRDDAKKPAEKPKSPEPRPEEKKLTPEQEKRADQLGDANKTSQTTEKLKYPKDISNKTEIIKLKKKLTVAGKIDKWFNDIEGYSSLFEYAYSSDDDRLYIRDREGVYQRTNELGTALIPCLLDRVPTGSLQDDLYDQAMEQSSIDFNRVDRLSSQWKDAKKNAIDKFKPIKSGKLGYEYAFDNEILYKRKSGGIIYMRLRKQFRELTASHWEDLSQKMEEIPAKFHDSEYESAKRSLATKERSWEDFDFGEDRQSLQSAKKRPDTWLKSNSYSDNRFGYSSETKKFYCWNKKNKQIYILTNPASVYDEDQKHVWEPIVVDGKHPAKKLMY